MTLSGDGPVAAVRNGGDYDIIDLSADFLDTAEANVTAFTVQAIAGYLLALRPGGIVSIPVSIRDFPVYALRMLATARAALLAAGIDDPAAHIVVYRSAWSARILLSNRPWDAARIATLRKFCDDRSFDVSWYPGMDPVAARGSIYNDLPAVSFANGEVTSAWSGRFHRRRSAPGAGAYPDAIARRPSTWRRSRLDRPFFYAVLRLDQLDTILKRLEILPQAEIGALVNLAVLAQAVVIALLVLLVPLAAPRRLRLPEFGLLRPIVYFPALGLGFLFIEIYLIEKASLWLNDRTSGFALVLTGMLIFSGFGSMVADRLERARQGIIIAGIVIVCWCGIALPGLAAGHSRDARPALDRPRLPGAGGARPGLAGARPAVPARPGAHRLRRDAALGLGAERRIFCGRDATRQPDCARGGLQPGSALRRDAVCGRADAFPAARKNSAWQLLSARSRAAE